MSRHTNVVNADEVDWKTDGNGDRFEFERKWLTSCTGAKKLGCSIYRVAPGKTAFPFHKHFTNEEAIFIISGTGTMRMDEEKVSVRSGDFISMIPDGPSHQLINTGDSDLEYLCMSTMIDPDITLFPDSDKVIAFAGSGPGGDKSARTFNGIYKANSTVGYYDDE
jgi:uncharacterized cupin superfamily protein